MWVVARFLATFALPVGLGFVAALWAALALPLVAAPAALTTYGSDKAHDLFTLTLLTAAAATLVRDRAGLLGLAWAWVAGAAVLSLGALTGVTAAGRSTGFEESNPIWLGRAIATGLVIVAWLAVTRRLRLSVALPLAALLLAGVFATGSRGPLLGAAVGVLVVLALVGRVAGVFVLAWLGVVAVTALWWSRAAQESRFGAAILDPSGDVNASTREQLWRDTWGIIVNHPGGVGFGNWSRHVGGTFLVYPHDLFLEVLAELGWFVGAVLVSALAVVVVRLARRGVGDPFAALVLALLGCETVAASVSGDINSRTWWFLLVLGWVASRWSADPHELDEPGATSATRATGTTRGAAASAAASARAVR